MKEWRGIPREEIPWYPTIDEEKCIGCRACVEFCPNGVLEFDESDGKARVKNPYNCAVECQACARVCPVEAISFPDEKSFTAYIKERLAKRCDDRKKTRVMLRVCQRLLPSFTGMDNFGGSRMCAGRRFLTTSACIRNFAYAKSGVPECALLGRREWKANITACDRKLQCKMFRTDFEVTGHG